MPKERPVMLEEGHLAVKSLSLIDDNNQLLGIISSENGRIVIDVLGTRKVSIDRDNIAIDDGQGNARLIPFR